MQHPQYVNERYWRQQALFSGGRSELLQTFRVFSVGATQARTVSMVMSDPATEAWVEAEVPIWRGTWSEHDQLLNTIGVHIERGETYLSPF